MWKRLFATLLLCAALPAAPSRAGAYLSGVGNTLAGPVTLDGGLVKVTMTHNGSSNFAVVIKRANGEYVDLLANVIGSYSGSRAVAIDSGNHVFEVDADGAWTIEVRKPWRWPRSLTATYSGTGDTVPRVFRTDGGLLKLRYAYTGESNFAIILYKTNGRYIDLIANEIGSTSGSSGVTVGKGKYVLDITAEESWTVRVRRLS